MLLVIDVGNTNITLGLLEGKDVVATFRLTSQASCTSDEYGSQIAEMIEKVLNAPEDEKVISTVRAHVNDLMKNYPIFAY